VSPRVSVSRQVARDVSGESMRASDFDNKVVYVVGGSMGIGLAIARRAAALGADLVIFARRKEPLVQATAAIEQARTRPGRPVTHHQVDVADPAQVQEVMSVAVAESGAPDVLINCAGRARPDYFENISHERFADTMRVNLNGCWNTVSALVPHMKRRGGYIVNTSSLAGLVGVFGYTDYCASKFALIGFSEALRSELKPHGITVSVLCPPDTRTPGFDEENKTKPRETHAVSAAARLLGPEQVADALIAGMAKKSFIIIPGVDGRFTFLAKRLLPGVVERIMDRQIRRARKRRGHPVERSRGRPG